MRKITLSKNRCTYIIVSADSSDTLEKEVNDILEQGWETEGAPDGGWTLLGGANTDGKCFFQTMMNCPKSYNTEEGKIRQV